MSNALFTLIATSAAMNPWEALVAIGSLAFAGWVYYLLLR